MRIDDDLLAILACPACHGSLRVDSAAQELVCAGCGRAYPVRDGIPVLLVDEAREPVAEAPAAPADEPPDEPTDEPGPADGS